MDNRTNTIAMMVLGAMVIALGGTLVSAEFFHQEKPEGVYIVEGVIPEGGEGGAVADVSIAALLPTADAAKGADVFKKCAACHTVNQGGASGVGPNLWGVMGAKHGHTPGFAYSEVLKGKPEPWGFDNMNLWLHSPRTYAAGTKMTFAGLSKPEDRANVIAYLNSLGSNLPIPAAPAAKPADAAPMPANVSPGQQPGGQPADGAGKPSGAGAGGGAGGSSAPQGTGPNTPSKAGTDPVAGPKS